MGIPAKPPVTDMRDFGGLIVKADAQDLPAGSAAKQVNIQSLDPGRLDVRRGLREVTFES